ncbi:MAG: hypothetical protein K0R66_959 [Gammaproteobacteria bacterium]|jgi:hypothetical protein|nr:hypothetical protein [Gammaproteobacteria bacterium]
MNIKHAALSLNEFYKAINELPDSLLKSELEAHVQEMVASMLKNCLMRNQQRNFVIKAQDYHQKQGHFHA